jgi:hypothetical protein
VSLHSTVDPNFSSVIFDTFEPFSLCVTFKVCCNGFFCLAVLHKMYSAICGLCTHLDTRWQQCFLSLLNVYY